MDTVDIAVIDAGAWLGGISFIHFARVMAWGSGAVGSRLWLPRSPGLTASLAIADHVVTLASSPDAVI